MRRIAWAVVLVLSSSIVAGCGPSRPMQAPVTPDQAGMALTAARAKLGAPYVFGGRGPDSFDCSGIITWAYRQAIPSLRLYIGAGETANDAGIEALYRWNYRQVTPGELVPGDLIFLSDGSADVTHGGLVVSVTSDAVYFLNASSYWGMVVEDDWPLIGEKRGQRVAGYGRLMTGF